MGPGLSFGEESMWWVPANYGVNQAEIRLGTKIAGAEGFWADVNFRILCGIFCRRSWRMRFVCVKSRSGEADLAQGDSGMREWENVLRLLDEFCCLGCVGPGVYYSLGKRAMLLGMKIDAFF